MRIGVIIAMDIEYQMMLGVLGGKPEGVIAGNEVILWQCGIGKVNAAIGTMELIQKYHPDCIINTGLAGGIDASLHVQDVVAGSQVAYHDVWCGEGNEIGQVQGLPARFDGNERLLEFAQSIKEKIESCSQLHIGLICSGDQFITNKEELAKIKHNYPDGLACEMESAAIAHTCYLKEIPFLCLRIISDTPGNTENHQLQWLDFLKSMSNTMFSFVYQYLLSLPNSL